MQMEEKEPWVGVMGDIRSNEHLSQVLANIAGDARLTGGERDSASQLARDQTPKLNDGSETEPDTWDEACSARLAGLSQAAIPLLAAEANVLGNVWGKNSFERSIAQQVGCDHSEAKRLIELALKPAARLSRDDQADLLAMKQQVHLRTNTVWLFVNETAPADPYDKVNLGRLPCALGLSYSMGEAFIAFSVPFAVLVSARRPCVYDAGWYFQEFWRSNGRTKSICATLPAVAGYAEWIANSPSLDQLGNVLLEAQVTDTAPAGTHQYD
jgi:hypothetical protein